MKLFQSYGILLAIFILFPLPAHAGDMPRYTIGGEMIYGGSADLAKAGQTDSIEHTVNYRTLTKQIISHVESSQRFTVEALATDIAGICLAQDGVASARVRVEKPGALRFARSVGVEIERTAD